MAVSTGLSYVLSLERLLLGLSWILFKRTTTAQDAPIVSSRLFIADHMLAGSIVMLIGCLFLIGYKQIARTTGMVSRGGYSRISRSGAEQMLTILGSLLLVFGFGCFLFF